jgi:hypothetical protein
MKSKKKSSKSKGINIHELIQMKMAKAKFSTYLCRVHTQFQLGNRKLYEGETFIYYVEEERVILKDKKSDISNVSWKDICNYITYATHL